MVRFQWTFIFMMISLYIVPILYNGRVLFLYPGRRWSYFHFENKNNDKTQINPKPEILIWPSNTHILIYRWLEGTQPEKAMEKNEQSEGLSLWSIASIANYGAVGKMFKVRHILVTASLFDGFPVSAELFAAFCKLRNLQWKFDFWYLIGIWYLILVFVFFFVGEHAEWRVMRGERIV